MKRIDIHYGGERYSVGGRDVDGVLTEIEQGLGTGGHWLEVNDGDGAPRTAYLLITSGVPVAVVPVPDESEHVNTGSMGTDG